MNGCRESDSFVVSGKPSNKVRDNKRMAEKVEKRRLAKGNIVGRNKGRTQSRETLPSELDRIRQKAKRDNFHDYPSRRLRVTYLRQEPSALAAQAGICAGGAGNRHSYRDQIY